MHCSGRPVQWTSGADQFGFSSSSFYEYVRFYNFKAEDGFNQACIHNKMFTRNVYLRLKCLFYLIDNVIKSNRRLICCPSWTWSFSVEFEFFAFQDVSVRATTLSRPVGNRSQTATRSEFVFKNSLFQVEFELFASQGVSVRATTLSRPGMKASVNNLHFIAPECVEVYLELNLEF